MLSACQNNSVGVSVAVVAWPDFFEACEVIKIIHTSKARESPDMGVRPRGVSFHLTVAGTRVAIVYQKPPRVP